MSVEVWKPVVESPNYEVSNHGRVRSLRSGNLLTPYPTGPERYLAVALCDHGEKKYRKVHRLVAEHFMEVSIFGCKVAHIDGDVNHNHVTNLRVDLDRPVAGPGYRPRTSSPGVSERVLSRFDI